MVYTVVLGYDPEERVYNASVPVLPGCFAWGKTRAQAIRRAKEVIATYLDAQVGSSMKWCRNRLLEVSSVNAVDFANKSIARDLVKKRESAGLTQAEVARRAKIRPEVLSKIESGRGNPTVATVERILKAIDVGV